MSGSGKSFQQLTSEAAQSADIQMAKLLAEGTLSESDRAAYAGNNMIEAINKVKAAKLDRYQYLSEDLVGADNNITSTAYYVQRGQDMTQLVNDIDTVASKQVSSSEINARLTARQEEINEWANNNKLDTLFFLQILFITLTLISTLVFLNSNGLISSYLLNLFIVLASFFAVFVLITRARKTSVLRDGRYWHKMRFGSSKQPPIKPESTCPGDTPPTVPTPPPRPPVCNPNAATLGDLPVEFSRAWGGRAASSS